MRLRVPWKDPDVIILTDGREGRILPTGLGTFEGDPSGCVHVVSFSEVVYM